MKHKKSILGAIGVFVLSYFMMAFQMNVVTLASYNGTTGGLLPFIASIGISVYWKRSLNEDSVFNAVYASCIAGVVFGAISVLSTLFYCYFNNYDLLIAIKDMYSSVEGFACQLALLHRGMVDSFIGLCSGGGLGSLLLLLLYGWIFIVLISIPSYVFSGIAYFIYWLKERGWINWRSIDIDDEDSRQDSSPEIFAKEERPSKQEELSAHLQSAGAQNEETQQEASTPISSKDVYASKIIEYSPSSSSSTSREKFLSLDAPKMAETLNKLIAEGKSANEAMSDNGVTQADLMKAQVFWVKDRFIARAWS